MIEEALAAYTKSHRRPQFTDRLTISDWYALFPNEPGCAVTQYKWPDNFPNMGMPGVYLIFDANKSLLYVGMTTRNLNRRLGDYFGYVSGRGTGCTIKENMIPPWKARPDDVRTIPVEGLG